MRSRWSDEDAAGFVAKYGAEWGEALGLRTYSARLLGVEPSLVLHGGGNSSVKASWTDILGESVPAIFVKASGADMASIEPTGHCGLKLNELRRLRALPAMDDAAMVDQLRIQRLAPDAPTPSIEALVHAFLPATFVDHTHADAVLALTNRPDGEALVRRALGEDVIVLPYVTPGFELALAAAAAVEAHPGAVGMVLAHHGLVTWGDSARGSYEAMIDLVSRAERFLEQRPARSRPRHAESRSDAKAVVISPGPDADLDAKLAFVAPLVRGLLAEPTDDCDLPYRRVVVRPLATAEVLSALADPGARDALVSPPLTSDHLIRTKTLPLWVEGLPYDDWNGARQQLAGGIGDYCRAYEAYVARHAACMPPGMQPFDPRPRVVLIPGLGAFCAGPDERESGITRDITEHTIRVKSLVSAGGSYEGLPEEELFSMEYRTLQHAKLRPGSSPQATLRGHVALVTGAAGAIGTGVCQGLLEAGCLVAATDLPGARLDTLMRELEADFPGKVLEVALDVTDGASVQEGFAQVARMWGGVDLVVANAGIAAVAPLTELDLECYRRLEKVNVEGTLLVLAEAGRMFRRQGTGGDIVLISTKNVFAPGADFGAYSSTKAAAHQLARIASLELAADDVRVNMVAPDAVFAHGTCRSGLWAEVGPGRMRARGLDEAGLEAYYQSRNLLKARVTAAHVANAVLFFATRQTPTTGATIPVDGGLPDSTPR